MSHALQAQEAPETQAEEGLMDGLPEFHALLTHDGLPEFHALLAQDTDNAHAEAHILHSYPLFLESLTLRPLEMDDRDLLNAIIRHEQTNGLRWAA